MNHPDGQVDSDANHTPWYILLLPPMLNKGIVLFPPGIVGTHVCKKFAYPLRRDWIGGPVIFGQAPRFPIISW